MPDPTPLPAGNDALLFKVLLEKAADAIYFKDLESRYLRVSNRMVGVFNMDHPTQVEGKTDADFFTAEHAKNTRAIEQEIIATGLPRLDLEVRETWPDGTVTWASTSKFPLYDDDGNLFGTFGISRDITERKIAEERLEEVQMALIEQEKKAAVSEFAGTIMANIGSSVVEIGQALDRVSQKLQAAKNSPEKLSEAQEELREMSFIVRKLADLMRIQGA
ncbi:MAG: PAS domain-containing protein [Opitutaceae bacterium]|jgi:PAS domain S-box-containing protein